MRRLSCLPLLALSLAACEEGVVECTPPPNALAAAAPEGLNTIAPVAVWVTVVDSATGQNLSAGATGAYVSGEMADSLRHDYPTLLTAYGLPGRYTVVVQHPGYAPWGSDEVRVRAGTCGPKAAEVTARLRPAGGQP